MKTPNLLVAVFSLTLCNNLVRADVQPAGAPVPPAKPRSASQDGRQFTARAGATNPGPAVVRGQNVNIRGQASITSEVIARANTGDKVEVLEIVTLPRPKRDEPSVWAKVTLPATTDVWVSSLFIDSASNKVKVNRLNVRSGPGENHAIVGRIEEGAVVKPVETKGTWIKIEPPPGTYGFVASHLLEPVAPPTIASVTKPPTTPPEVVPPAEPKTEVTPPPTAEPPPTVAVVTPPPAPVTSEPPSIIVTPPVEPATTSPVPPEEEVWVKRVVTREGVVRRSVSIQAPTYFVLESLDNKRVMNYVYSPSTNIVLKDFQGARILVTGEESLDERWTTPVLTVDRLQVVEE
jgi:hypothetical protein